MKLPNFRLPETQAKASMFFAVLALLALAALVFFVFKGFQFEDRVIPYNADAGMGRFRRYLVFGGTAATLLVGATAGLLGFNSLGQKRNNRQGYSWLGLLIGAMAVSLAPVLFFAWQELSEAVIQG